MFSHMNLLSPAIGDPISVPTQDMLIGLYVLTIGIRRGICTNRYNPCNHINYQNEIVDDNNYKYTKEKEPSFCSSYDALGAYPIEVQYESHGIYPKIHEHYQIVKSVKKEIVCIYIRTTVGHNSFYREIEEAIQFCWNY
ncbi:hypothetical protein AMTRI_Chr12g268690 [Amborella trichopoda]